MNFQSTGPINEQMMEDFWNYRIVARRLVLETGDEKTVAFSIVECHYENGQPAYCSDIEKQNPGFLIDHESTENLTWTLDKMKDAFDKPILDFDNWPNIYHPNN